MEKRFVIFDLDQTLVDSRTLATARENKDWDTVRAGASHVQVYPGIHDLIRSLKNRGYKIAIVTSSPRDYCEEVCKRFDLVADVLVGFHDVSRIKPQPDPLRLAIALLNGYAEETRDQVKVKNFLRDRYYQFGDALYPQTIVVGDSYRDVVAAHESNNLDVIGVTWGLECTRELISSRPTYLANSVSDLKSLLLRHYGEYGPLEPQRSESEFAYNTGLWTRFENSRGEDFRTNLREGAAFYFARHRWEGKWWVSYGNDLVSNFKKNLHEYPAGEWAKDRAVEKFATELSYFLPRRAQVIFVRSSKIPSDKEYDNRFERLQSALGRIRSDIIFSNPISLTASGAAAHKSKDKKLRDPAEILKTLEWNGTIESSEFVYVIDDVLTSGGHFEAYIRMLQLHAPGTKAVGVFWTLHMGELHY